MIARIVALALVALAAQGCAYHAGAGAGYTYGPLPGRAAPTYYRRPNVIERHYQMHYATPMDRPHCAPYHRPRGERL